MPGTPFVHLHLHTQFSLLDGACRLNDIMERATEFGMPAVAMTDHGNLYGAVEFYKAATRAGIKPIIGCEAYIAPGSRLDKRTVGIREAAHHLVLLAKDAEGYQNLVRLISIAHLEGFYYRPRIDREILREYGGHLIGMSACLKGEIASAVLRDDEREARRLVEEYAGFFAPGDFYLEVMNHGLPDQLKVKDGLARLATETGIPLVATNDVHYLKAEHAEAHDLLLCIQTQKTVADGDRMKYGGAFHMRSAEEMTAVFPDLPGALATTWEIAEKCNLELTFDSIRYPVYSEGGNRDDRRALLRKLTSDGARRRFDIGLDEPPSSDEEREIQQRLELELDIIARTGFVSYFLIVWDFIHYARQKGIPVGPGRGSGAGSLVAFCLGITNIDPLRYGLLFERFLNPERVSPPDFDIDLCYDRRGEVIQYVRDKYGEDSVAQIITFGTLGAKSAVRDVARALGLPFKEGDRIAKLVPAELNITLDRALEIGAEFRKAYDSEQVTRQVVDFARTLEGLPRNASTHAAGVVIGDRPLVELVPLSRGNGDEVITQFPMAALDSLGLLKMDFLGLKTLTVIHDAVKLIHETRGETIDMDGIPLDDRPTFDLINRAETIGVFQIESPGMRDLSRRIGVDRFEDIIALVALFRPGPMKMLDDYVRRKKGEVEVRYDHPDLEPILRETYGVMLYQEQVMQVANVLAGFSLGQADILRRAMGKKKKEEMARQREGFLSGCRERKVNSKLAESIFENLARFAEYGFNKSHSAAYAMVCYQTAWLKAHYPVEFLAALMSNDMGNTDKIQGLVAEARSMGIEVLPPDVNRCDLKFTVHDGQIRFGLAAVKNVGDQAVEAIVDARRDGGPFASLFDFCARVDSHAANRKAVESLIRAGAFDSLGARRSQLYAVVEAAIGHGGAMQRDRGRGQGMLFGGGGDDDPIAEPALPEIDEWDRHELLSAERELLGIYVTGHPLTEHKGLLREYGLTPTSGLGELADGADVQVGGILARVEPRVTRKKEAMAKLRLEDLDGAVEVLVFPKAMEACSACLTADAVVAVLGRVDRREEEPKVIADEIIPLSEIRRRLTRKMMLQIDGASPPELARLRAVLGRHPGDCPVIFGVRLPEGGTAWVQVADRFGVAMNDDLFRELEDLAGPGSVRVVVGNGDARSNDRGNGRRPRQGAPAGRRAGGR